VHEARHALLSGSRLRKERKSCGNTQQPSQAAHQIQTGLAQGGGNRRTRAGLLCFGARAIVYVPEHRAPHSGRSYQKTTHKTSQSNSPTRRSDLVLLVPLVQRALNSDPDTDGAEPDSESENGHAVQLHAHYAREIRYICVTHTLVDAPDVHPSEGGKSRRVLGTILANCAQSRWRTDRIYRMKLHAERLVNDIRGQIVRIEETPTEEQFRSGLSRAWAVWA
jgi:hypothetical protein